MNILLVLDDFSLILTLRVNNFHVCDAIMDDDSCVDFIDLDT